MNKEMGGNKTLGNGDESTERERLGGQRALFKMHQQMGNCHSTLGVNNWI